MDRDFYEVLGVAKTADADSIKKAYRKLAMEFHPDRNPGNAAAEDKFKEAARAYEVLSNQEKRRRYDQFGHSGMNGFSGGQGFQDVGDIFSAFGDIFGDIFGGSRAGGRQRRPGGPARGGDLKFYMEIELKDVLSGIKKPIEFEADTQCKTCSGKGAEKGSEPEVCGTCRGSGQVVRSQGFFSMASTCTTCSGAGQIIKKPCKSCRGRGREQTHRKLTVNMPAGVHNGTQLRLSGEGEGGYFGGPAGDLYVEVRIKEDERFVREDDHLIGELSISYLQAILGGEIEVETLEGEDKATVEPGTSPDDLVRLPGKGVPNLRSGKRGDLIYRLGIEIPSKLEAEEEKLLRQIAELKKVKVGAKGWWRK